MDVKTCDMLDNHQVTPLSNPGEVDNVRIGVADGQDSNEVAGVDKHPEVNVLFPVEPRSSGVLQVCDGQPTQCSALESLTNSVFFLVEVMTAVKKPEVGQHKKSVSNKEPNPDIRKHYNDERQ